MGPSSAQKSLRPFHKPRLKSAEVLNPQNQVCFLIYFWDHVVNVMHLKYLAHAAAIACDGSIGIWGKEKEGCLSNYR